MEGAFNEKRVLREGGMTLTSQWLVVAQCKTNFVDSHSKCDNVFVNAVLGLRDQSTPVRPLA